MTQTLKINVARPLTAEQLEKVQAYAESLLANQPQAKGDEYVDVDAIRGIFAGLGGNKSDKELIRESWDEIASKYDD